MVKKKKVKRISGRRIEGLVAKFLRDNNKKYYVYRYNENRRNATPADMQVQTPKFDILLEVKASSNNTIQMAAVRKTQKQGLKTYHKRFKRNLSIYVFYYNLNKKYVMIDVISLGKMKGHFTYEKTSKIGYKVKDWGKVNGYFRKVYNRKRRISSGK